MSITFQVWFRLHASDWEMQFVHKAFMEGDYFSVFTNYSDRIHDQYK